MRYTKGETRIGARVARRRELRAIASGTAALVRPRAPLGAFIAIACVLLAACAAAPREPAVPQRYVVKPQDTLYSIAWRLNLDYRDMARLNHIGPDFKIAVGQTLILEGVRRVDAGVLPAGDARVAAPAPPSVPSRTAVTRAQAADALAASHAAGLMWSWPTERRGALQPVSGGGILIPGVIGQEVRAASAGRVVYNGDGIRGYGNLIIIKHGDAWLTSYAHNADSLVHEGQEVLADQVIAHMGEGAPGKPVLYFEIRRNGKPLDPLPLLAPAGDAKRN